MVALGSRFNVTLPACCSVDVVNGAGGPRFASRSSKRVTMAALTSATAAAKARSRKYGLSSVAKSGLTSHSAENSFFAEAKNSNAPK